MPNQELKELFQKYLDNQLTPKELDRFLNMLHDASHEMEASELMSATWQEMFEATGIDARPAKVVSMHKTKWWRTIAAAIIILILGGGALLYFNKSTEKPIAVMPVQQEIMPGGNKATLTVGNGQKIVLDETKNGTVNTGDNTQVTKTDGQLTYATTTPAEVSYHTITTPRGGKYELVLPDGTKVLLDAASSLRFPTAFTGNERDVQLTGQGYFEVAKNAEKPFHVNVNGMQVEVLGTHFNINAYDDEAVIKTTLLEGSVKVTKGNEATKLQPGQQAQLNKDGNLQLIKEADTEEATAWINGEFLLNGSDVAAFMRQVSRWYDVDVVYEGKLPEGHFKGKTSRSLNLSQMFKVLEYMGINYKIEGKKIIIKADQP